MSAQRHLRWSVEDAYTNEGHTRRRYVVVGREVVVVGWVKGCWSSALFTTLTGCLKYKGGRSAHSQSKLGPDDSGGVEGKCQRHWHGARRNPEEPVVLYQPPRLPVVHRRRIWVLHIACVTRFGAPSSLFRNLRDHSTAHSPSLSGHSQCIPVGRAVQMMRCRQVERRNATIRHASRRWLDTERDYRITT